MVDVNYDTDALMRGIEAAKRNIATFEEAIQREKNTIDEYRGYINILRQKKKDQGGKSVTVDEQKGGVAKNGEEKD
ncbi:hypothetical protein GTO10_02420 [Candidatus Saccharibacteria bacterium]|nr:hypothetical protein [Candidatus Saccharibacteria bacterium]